MHRRPLPKRCDTSTRPENAGALLAALSEPGPSPDFSRYWKRLTRSDQQRAAGAISSTRPFPSALGRPLLAVLAIFGPGLIAANAGNDAGGILTYASAGSQFGYRTLFLMVLITVALVVVQEMCSRLGVFTGEGLGGLIREQFSAAAPLRAGPAAGRQRRPDGQRFAGVGAAMEIFGVSKYISVPSPPWRVGSDRPRLVLQGRTALPRPVVGLFDLSIAAFLGHPERGGLQQPVVAALPPHALVPVARGRSHRHHHHAVHAVLRGLGRGGQGHQACRLPQGADRHRQRRHLERRHQHLHHHRHGGRHRWHAAHCSRPAKRPQALEPVVGPAAPGSSAWPARRFAARGVRRAALDRPTPSPTPPEPPRSVSGSFRQAPLFYGLFTLQIVVGAAVALAPGNLVSLVVNAQVLNGIITPMLLTYVLILANRKQRPGSCAATGRSSTWWRRFASPSSAAVVRRSRPDGLGVG